MIIDHTLPEYKRLRDSIGASRYNKELRRRHDNKMCMGRNK